MHPVAGADETQVRVGELGLTADRRSDPPARPRRSPGAPRAAGRTPRASAATSLSTRNSSLGRPAASGVECQSAKPMSSPPSRTRVVSPMRRSRVRVISRVKSTPGASSSVKPPALLDACGRADGPPPRAAPGAAPVRRGNVADQRDGEVTRHQADAAVEADVLHRPRHRLQADGAWRPAPGASRRPCAPSSSRGPHPADRAEPPADPSSLRCRSGAPC